MVVMPRGLYSLMRVLAFAAVGGLLLTLCPCGHAAAEPASPQADSSSADHACCPVSSPAAPPAVPQSMSDASGPHDCPHCEAASPSACGELETATVPGPSAPTDSIPAATPVTPIFLTPAQRPSPALHPAPTEPLPRCAGTLCAQHRLLLI